MTKESVELLVRKIASTPTNYFKIDTDSKDTIGGLTKVPLILEADWGDIKYKTFAEALEKEDVQVLDKYGVNEVEIVNNSDYNIFIPAGQMFVSQEMGRQDRMAVSDIMVEKGTSMLPVRCVEHHRWSGRDSKSVDRYLRALGGKRSRGHFASVSHMAPRGLIEETSYLISTSADRGYSCFNAPIQEQIWDKVEEETKAADAKTTTGTAAEIFTKKQEEKDKFKIYENEIGGIFLGNEKVLGMEFYHSQDAWQRLAKPTIMRYKIGIEKKETTVDEKAMGEFLDYLSKAKTKAYKSSGKGYDVRLKEEHVTGSSLVVDETPAHFLAMPIYEKKRATRLDFSGLGIRTRGDYGVVTDREIFDEPNSEDIFIGGPLNYSNHRTVLEELGRPHVYRNCLR